MQDYVSKLAMLLVNAKGDPDSAAGAEVQVRKLLTAKLHDREHTVQNMMAP